MMYLNRKNIDLINAVKQRAIESGLVFCQTNSRQNGNYLSACRVYKTLQDKGHPDRAIWVGCNKNDFQNYLTGAVGGNNNE